jgi:four helix bundle protein
MEKHRTPNTERRTSNGAGGRGTGRVFDLEDRLLEFASAVIAVTEKLPNSRSGNHVAGQLLRSGTSPFSNHGEAESAESPDDFIHKLKICLKELRETRRWLRLIYRQSWLRTDQQLQAALIEVEELTRIFVASIRTAKQNQIQSKTNKSTPDTRS